MSCTRNCGRLSRNPRTAKAAFCSVLYLARAGVVESSTLLEMCRRVRFAGSVIAVFLALAAGVCGDPDCQAAVASQDNRTESGRPSDASENTDRPLVKRRIVFSKHSAFNNLVLVVDEGDLRYLRFGSEDGDDQSVISLRDPNSVPMECVRYAAIGLCYATGRKRTLMIGLGGGTFTSLLRKHFPEMSIDVVEIDPLVVDVAERFFGVREARDRSRNSCRRTGQWSPTT
jgi:predicted membrane-bound spermidine synthase